VLAGDLAQCLNESGRLRQATDEREDPVAVSRDALLRAAPEA